MKSEYVIFLLRVPLFKPTLFNTVRLMHNLARRVHQLINAVSAISLALARWSFS